MYVITAIAVNRVTGEPDYFLVVSMGCEDEAQPPGDASANGVIYRRGDLIELLESSGKVVVLRAGHAPLPVEVRYGTHGYRYFESVEHGRSTDALKRLPRFAFVNEANAADVTRLHALARGAPDHGAAFTDDALERYVRYGWVRQAAAGPELTSIGRALLAYA